ncbi:MAG: hypothetical protein AAGB31_09865, partial [Bdellovibrio sp.]
LIRSDDLVESRLDVREGEKTDAHVGHAQDTAHTHARPELREATLSRDLAHQLEHALAPKLRN